MTALQRSAREDSRAGHGADDLADAERALRRRLRRFGLGLALMTLAVAAGVVGYVELFDRWLRFGTVVQLGRMNLNLRVVAFEGAFVGLLALGALVIWWSRKARE